MSAATQVELVDADDDGQIEVLVIGEGPTVICLPSLGRSAEDFVGVATRVALEGYRMLLPQPRGIGESTGSLVGLTMQDLADDAARVLTSLNGIPSIVVGHAFGNRVARMLATLHPELTESVVLLACGGMVPPAAEVSKALVSVFDERLSKHEHLQAVRTAFFAPGNDPSAWEGGWHPIVAAAQAAATTALDVNAWWTAGSADVLIVQPADDVVAVPENGQQLLAALGSRAAMVEIAHAGHALLPEQPEAVARTLLRWLGNPDREPQS
jgi:pimeloyl-ACP methyl ester carboxylesterase